MVENNNFSALLQRKILSKIISIITLYTIKTKIKYVFNIFANSSS